MESEQESKKTKRVEEGEEQSEKKPKLSNFWKEHQKKIAAVATGVRSATKEQVQQDMIDFLQRCDPTLYTPPSNDETLGYRIVSHQLIEKIRPCGAFYRRPIDKGRENAQCTHGELEDDDNALFADYEFCRQLCSIHVFHCIAEIWSHSPDSCRGSHHQQMLFHVLRHRAEAEMIPLAPVLKRLMKIAWDRSHYPSIKDHASLDKVPSFAKPMLATMHYSNLVLLRKLDNGHWAFLVDNCKQEEAFARIACSALYQDPHLFHHENTLLWACKAAQKAIVQKYNWHLAAREIRTLGVSTIPLEIRVATGQYYDFGEC